MSEHVGNWREPLHVGIIVVIICMMYAFRRCVSHSHVDTHISLLTMAWAACYTALKGGMVSSEARAAALKGGMVSSEARADAGGNQAWCIGLKVIWRNWTFRTSNWQSRDTWRTVPACRLAWTSPKKIWLDRIYVYIEHMTVRVKCPRSTTGCA